MSSIGLILSILLLHLVVACLAHIGCGRRLGAAIDTPLHAVPAISGELLADLLPHHRAPHHRRSTSEQRDLGTYQGDRRLQFDQFDQPLGRREEHGQYVGLHFGVVHLTPPYFLRQYSAISSASAVFLVTLILGNSSTAACLSRFFHLVVSSPALRFSIPAPAATGGAARSRRR